MHGNICKILVVAVTVMVVAGTVLVVRDVVAVSPVFRDDWERNSVRRDLESHDESSADELQSCIWRIIFLVMTTMIACLANVAASIVSLCRIMLPMLVWSVSPLLHKVFCHPLI